MERIYPKKTEQISLYEAAQLLKCGKEPFVLYPTDEQAGTYERQTLEEFLEDCMFFIKGKYYTEYSDAVSSVPSFEQGRVLNPFERNWNHFEMRTLPGGVTLIVKMP